MKDHAFLVVIMAVMFLIWMAVELGWGGGDPNHRDHNQGDRGGF